MLALHDLGRAAEFESAFSELRERWGNRWPSEVAHVYAWIGDADAAFEWLDKAYDQRSTDLVYILRNRWHKNLWDDPRYPVFIEKMGLLEEWKAIPKPDHEVQP